MASAPRIEPAGGPDISGEPPALRFRTHLLILVLAVALPLALLAAALVIWTASGRREEALQQLAQTARTLQTAVDREIGLTVAALQALGTSPALDAALAERAGSSGAAPFHAQATALVNNRPGALRAIWLARADIPQTVVNTRLPPGLPLPLLETMRFPERPLGPPPDPAATFRNVVSQRRPYVTDLLRGPAVGWTVVVVLPVERDGRVVGVLAAGLTPQSLSAVLQEQASTPGTTAALIDRGGVVMARSVNPDRYVGRGASPDLLAVVRDPDLGARRIEGTMLEGERVYGAVHRLETAPLTIAYGAPRSVVDTPLRSALAMAGGGALLALALAIGGALWLGRRLGAEVAGLAEDARALASGSLPAPRSAPRVREVAAARAAMRQSAASLADAEARFTRAAAAARMATWEWDLATGGMTGSPGREALYGRPPGALPDRGKVIEAVHPEDRAAVLAAWDRALSGVDGGRYEAEFRAVWLDGTVRWLRSQGRVQFDPDHKPIRMSGALVDVTERRLAEAALRDSERWLRLAQQVGGIGVWERDLLTGAATWSEQEYRLHGFDPAMPAPDLDVLRALMAPEDRDIPLLFDRLRDAGMTVDEGSVPMSAEYRSCDARTGEIRWLRVVGRALAGPDGKFVRVVGVSLDVTESREAEERQRLLMREVDHRAKNALAVALSVVQLAPRDLPPDAFAAAVTGRIAAMARTHSLLAEQRWEGAELRALMEGELAAHAAHVVLDGPALRLLPDAAQPVAMILHELATNAAKHGALSVPGGEVCLSWRVAEDGWLHLDWVEQGGPPLAGMPARNGFGSRLLISLAERQLGGQVDLDWTGPDGLRVKLLVPPRHLLGIRPR